MAFPTDDQITMWNSGEDGAGTMQDIMGWAGMSPALVQAVVSGMGTTPTAHYRVISFITDEDVADLIASARVVDPDGGDGRALTLVEKSQVRLFVNAVRTSSGTLPAPPAAATPPQIVVQAPPPDQGANSANSVAMNGTVSLVGTVMAKRITIDEENELHKQYKLATKGDCPAGAAPTRDQLSAFRAVVKEEDAIEVDFAAWVPHANRMLKKREMEGLRPGPNGTMLPIRLYGPPNPRDWGKSYKLFRTAAIMYQEIDLEWHDRYHDMIQDFAADAPPEAWPLIYQVEARTRSEYALTLRRQLTEKHELAVKMGWPTDFDENRPWNSVWKSLVTDQREYWRDEIKDPCILIRTHVELPTDRIGHDHPVARPASAATSSHEPATRINAIPQVPTNITKKRAATQGHDSEEEGEGQKRHKTNNSGTFLCPGFNDGGCTKKLGNRCAKDKNAAHQCSICLDNRHGAHECPRLQKNKKSKGAAKRKRAGRAKQ